VFTVWRVSAGDVALPKAKPVPDVAVVPRLYAQPSFERQGLELTHAQVEQELGLPF